MTAEGAGERTGAFVVTGAFEARQKWRVLGVASLGAFLSTLNITIVNGYSGRRARCFWPRSAADAGGGRARPISPSWRHSWRSG